TWYVDLATANAAGFAAAPIPDPNRVNASTGTCPGDFPVKVTAEGWAYAKDHPAYAQVRAVVCYRDVSTASAAGYKVIPLPTPSPSPTPPPTPPPPPTPRTELNLQVCGIKSKQKFIE